MCKYNATFGNYHTYCRYATTCFPIDMQQEQQQQQQQKENVAWKEIQFNNNKLNKKADNGKARKDSNKRKDIDKAKQDLNYTKTIKKDNIKIIQDSNLQSTNILSIERKEYLRQDNNNMQNQVTDAAINPQINLNAIQSEKQSTGNKLDADYDKISIRMKKYPPAVKKTKTIQSAIGGKGPRHLTESNNSQKATPIEVDALTKAKDNAKDVAPSSREKIRRSSPLSTGSVGIQEDKNSLSSIKNEIIKDLSPSNASVSVTKSSRQSVETSKSTTKDNPKDHKSLSILNKQLADNEKTFNVSTQQIKSENLKPEIKGFLVESRTETLKGGKNPTHKRSELKKLKSLALTDMENTKSKWNFTQERRTNNVKDKSSKQQSNKSVMEHEYKSSFNSQKDVDRFSMPNERSSSLSTRILYRAKPNLSQKFSNKCKCERKTQSTSITNSLKRFNPSNPAKREQKPLVKVKSKVIRRKRFPLRKVEQVKPSGQMAIDNNIWFECNMPIRVNIPASICMQNLFGFSPFSSNDPMANSLVKADRTICPTNGTTVSPLQYPKFCISIGPGLTPQLEQSQLTPVKNRITSVRAKSNKKHKKRKKSLANPCEISTQTSTITPTVSQFTTESDSGYSSVIFSQCKLLQNCMQLITKQMAISEKRYSDEKSSNIREKDIQSPSISSGSSKPIKSERQSQHTEDYEINEEAEDRDTINENSQLLQSGRSNLKYIQKSDSPKNNHRRVSMVAETKRESNVDANSMSDFSMKFPEVPRNSLVSGITNGLSFQSDHNKREYLGFREMPETIVPHNSFVYNHKKDTIDTASNQNSIDQEEIRHSYRYNSLMSHTGRGLDGPTGMEIPPPGDQWSYDSGNQHYCRTKREMSLPSRSSYPGILANNTESPNLSQSIPFTLQEPQDEQKHCKSWLRYSANNMKIGKSPFDQSQTIKNSKIVGNSGLSYIPAIEIDKLTENCRKCCLRGNNAKNIEDSNRNNTNRTSPTQDNIFKSSQENVPFDHLLVSNKKSTRKLTEITQFQRPSESSSCNSQSLKKSSKICENNRNINSLKINEMEGLKMSLKQLTCPDELLGNTQTSRTNNEQSSQNQAKASNNSVDVLQSETRRKSDENSVSESLQDEENIRKMFEKKCNEIIQSDNFKTESNKQKRASELLNIIKIAKQELFCCCPCSCANFTNRQYTNIGIEEMENNNKGEQEENESFHGNYTKHNWIDGGEEQKATEREQENKPNTSEQKVEDQPGGSKKRNSVQIILPSPNQDTTRKCSIVNIEHFGPTQKFGLCDYESFKKQQLNIKLLKEIIHGESLKRREQSQPSRPKEKLIENKPTASDNKPQLKSDKKQLLLMKNKKKYSPGSRSQSAPPFNKRRKQCSCHKGNRVNPYLIRATKSDVIIPPLSRRKWKKSSTIPLSKDTKVTQHFVCKPESPIAARKKLMPQEDNCECNCPCNFDCTIDCVEPESDAMLEEYELTGECQSYFTPYHPSQKGGTEMPYTDHSVESQHSTNMKVASLCSLDEEHIESILDSLSLNYTKDMQKQQPLVLVPFRLGNNNCAKMVAICEADDWREIKLSETTVTPIPKQTSNSNNQAKIRPHSTCRCPHTDCELPRSSSDKPWPKTNPSCQRKKSEDLAKEIPTTSCQKMNETLLKSSQVVSPRSKTKCKTNSTTDENAKNMQQLYRDMVTNKETVMIMQPRRLHSDNSVKSAKLAMESTMPNRSTLPTDTRERSRLSDRLHNNVPQPTIGEKSLSIETTCTCDMEQLIQTLGNPALGNVTCVPPHESLENSRQLLQQQQQLWQQQQLIQHQQQLLNQYQCPHSGGTFSGLKQNNMNYIRDCTDCNCWVDPRNGRQPMGQHQSAESMPSYEQTQNYQQYPSYPFGQVNNSINMSNQYQLENRVNMMTPSFYQNTITKYGIERIDSNFRPPHISIECYQPTLPHPGINSRNPCMCMRQSTPVYNYQQPVYKHFNDTYTESSTI